MFSSILVVCTGNICRSPIGEYLLRERWAKSEARVASAGVAALIGYPADEEAIAVMQAVNIDMSGHRAQQLTQTLCSAHDLILVMEKGHEDWINSRLPTARGRVHRMTKWLEGDGVVPDPYRRGHAAFEDSYALLDRCVDSWISRIS